MGKLKNRCSIYLVFAGKKVKLPVNPEEIETKHPTNHKTYDVIGVGEIVVPRKPSLKEVSWESFFPGDRSAVYVNSGAKAPSYYLKYFENALKKKQICRLIITRSGGYDTNMKCIVSNFEAEGYLLQSGAEGIPFLRAKGRIDSHDAGGRTGNCGSNHRNCESSGSAGS